MMVPSKLKLAVLESGLKQRFIAQQAGIKENRLTCAVTGRSKLSPDEKARVAEILGKDIADLFPEEN